MRHLPRLYYNQQPLKIGAILPLGEEERHHIISVLRLEINDNLRIFNETDGQFTAKIQHINKKQCLIQCDHFDHAPEQPNNLHLYFAPIKSERLLVCLEKSVELGVHNFTPLITEYTTAKMPRPDKIGHWFQSALQQSGRMIMPKLHPEIYLGQLIHNNQPFLYGHEWGRAQPLAQIVPNYNQQMAIVIGPEGGFSDKEFAQLEQCPLATAFSLGAFILRSETAAIAAISTIQNILLSKTQYKHL